VNTQLAAGIALLALIFGGIYVAAGLDMGWLPAALCMAAALTLSAAMWAAAILISDGMDRR
jgi:hypothetical protein